MRTVPVLTGAEAARLIGDSDVITVSSSSGLGCPDAVLKAVGQRYAETGAPANLTTLHPIAAGDMYGIKGIDHLCRPGQLRRVLAGSYPSGGSKLDPPLIRRLIHNDQIQALNIPSGVLFQMHRAASTGQPGVLTEVGLGTYADPRLEGGKMNTVTDDFVRLMQVGGNDYLFYPAVKVDVAIIRATTSDPHGNLSYEQECGTLGALDQAYAAHNNGGIVIAQVKRLSDTQLPTQRVHIPGILVDAIVVAPNQMQTTQTVYDPALSGEVHRDLDDIEPVEFGLEKVIARRAAAELQVDAVVNLGFGISAAIPRVLLEEGHAEDVTWVIEQGAVGGFPATGFAFGCALNPQALVQSVDQFTLLQGGGFDVAMLSFLEVSGAGDVNVSYLAARPHITAGVGGFNDIVTRAPKIVYSGYFTAGKKDIQIGDGKLHIVSDGAVAKFVPEVAQISFSGEMARRRRQDVLYVTERCVIQLTESGLMVIEIAPGVDLERDVLAKADIELLVSSDLRFMSAALFRPEPMGLILSRKPPRIARSLQRVDHPHQVALTDRPVRHSSPRRKPSPCSPRIMTTSLSVPAPPAAP
jgi:propionate CoA-transferase